MSILQIFLQQYNVNDKQACEILGIKNHSSISRWRSGSRSMPEYIERSIRLHLEIPRLHQQRLRRKYVTM